MANVVIIYAHPYPDRSRAGRALISAVRELPRVSVRSLYDLYPDFAIDVAEEQEALRRADVIVLQHPLYWYSVPGLLKHWFDKVLARGFAYGQGGRELVGKRCLWVTTTGGEPDAYAAGDAARLLPGPVPVTVLHGELDDRVPVEMSRRLRGVELVELAGVEHFGLIDPLAPAWSAVLSAIEGRH